MQTIICIAEEGERDLVARYLPDLHAPVRVTGVGAVNIIRSLQDLDRAETEIINIGYCGSANFEIGSLVSVTEARLNHPMTKYPEPTLTLDEYDFGMFQPEGLLHAPCYSNTDFVVKSDYKDCVFDMEAAYIAALGFARTCSLKLVSDNLSLKAYHELTNGVEDANEK